MRGRYPQAFSRRASSVGKAGPIYPPLAPSEANPIFAAEAYDIVCRHEPGCFLLVQETSKFFFSVYDLVYLPGTRRPAISRGSKR